MRRWCFALLLVVLVGGIAGYWRLTHPENIRQLAEQYLGRVTGGHAVVGSASLTLFEGLRLGDIAVYVHPDDAEPIFSAKACSIEYEVAKLLVGRLEATRIVALEPHVRLVEDTAAGTLNLVTLLEGRRVAPQPRLGPLKLPEVVLRAGVVGYATAGPDPQRQASVMLEGQLTPVVAPAAAQTYAFRLIGTGSSGMLGRTAADGPVIVGRLRLEDFLLQADLENYRLESDISSLLPEKVNHFFAEHELTGRVDVTGLSFSGPRQWDAQIELAGVRMSLLPERLLRASERRRLQHVRDAAVALDASLPGDDLLLPTTSQSVAARPLPLSNVSGRLVASEQKLEIRELAGDIAGNRLGASGTLVGYRFDAGSSLLLHSVGPLMLENSDELAASLPPAAREAFFRFRPEGRGRLALQLSREQPDEAVRVAGRLDLTDASATFDRVPYRIYGISGGIVLGHDAASGRGFVELAGLAGHGPVGTPNETCRISLNGRISPLIDGAGFDLKIRGINVTATAQLADALPTDVRQVLAQFAEQGEPYPKLEGEFLVHVVRPEGLGTDWSYDTDVQFRNASGRARVFPYPIRNASGVVKVRTGHLLLEDVAMQPPGGDVRLSGRVDWRHRSDRKLETRLDITAVGVRVDDDLLNSLPEGVRDDVVALGISGRLEAVGSVHVIGDGRDATDVSLAMKLSDGELFSGEGRYTLEDVAATMLLEGEQLAVTQATGRRAAGSVTGGATLDWSGEQPHLQLDLQGTQMKAEPALKALLPAAGVEAFEMLSPSGPFDASFVFRGAAGHLSTGDLEADLPPADFRLLLKPNGMAATFAPVPYALSDVQGEIVVTPTSVEIMNLAGRHEQASLELSGDGRLVPGSDRLAWSLKLSLAEANLDEALQDALPEGVQRLLKSLSATGQASMRFDRFTLTPRPSEAFASDLREEDLYDVAFDGLIWTQGLNLDAGVALTEVNGWAKLSGTGTTQGLATLDGEAVIESLQVGERPGRNVRLKIAGDEQRNTLLLDEIRGQVAGGELSGRLQTAFATATTDGPPSRYQLQLAIRGADAAVVAGTDGQRVDGRISASLNLEGAWEDAASRRGRGDVLVEGQRLHRVPLLLGLMQVANLSLPVREPFREVKAAYNVDGQRINVESIVLQAANMRLTGLGSIDLASRDVDLTFTTDNTALPDLPIIGEVIEGAKDELLRIRVRGSLDNPAVGTGTLESIGRSLEDD